MASERGLAFAKVNLCLFVGPTRDDGRHELVTLFESVSLADELVISAAGADEVVCEGVTGPNLVTDALTALRAAGWSAPPVRVQIRKRIPIAAGMGGGSADAAALLRNAPRWAPVPDAVLREIAVSLGADVPSQLAPGASLGTGAGETLEPVAVPEHSLLVLPQPFSLSTAEVYREADQLGQTRSAQELRSLCQDLRASLQDGSLPDRLAVNDLQNAALSLRPEIAEALELARGAGAQPAMVCGSGPTVIGVFWGANRLREADAAADQLWGRYSGALAAFGIDGGTRAPAPND